jgi:predicted ATPase/transcriptional regulator with XRE-family HTH domain
MENDLSFGLWLQKRRKSLDLTRQELALRIGCSTSALRKIESDERRPSKQLAELLSDTLEIAADDRAAFIRIARGEQSVERLKSPLPVPTRNLFRPVYTFSFPVPIPPTPLIGRESELSALHQMLGDPQCRLITLVGPGGIGKTRLAIEAALEQNKDHGPYAVFVSLASLSSASLIAQAIADALELKLQGSEEPKAQLIRYLREKKTLLVLDNFEHLLDGVELLAEIIQFTLKVKILCTSREQLNVQGEWVFDVRGLDLPEGQVLFADCAHRVQTDFVLQDDYRLTIAHICRLVEGMPLAIELAATWIRILSLSEIEQEIQRDLDFLSTEMRDLPKGHRSMRAVFDHSWGLLAKEEQQVLSRLSVFRSGFALEAAKQVAGASLATLSSLVSKSLVQRTNVGRYSLHELLRQYTSAHLETDPALSAATWKKHYHFYLTLAQSADSQLRGSDQLEWLDRLEQEHDNLRAAIEWSLIESDKEPSEQRDLALELVAALRWFWYMRGYFHEGCDYLTKALDLNSQKLETDQVSPSPASTENISHPVNLGARARALEGQASMSNLLGNHSAAYTLAEQSAAICQNLGDKQGLANALLIMGHTLRWQGEVTLSHSRLKEALALYREAGDQWGAARCLFRLGKYLTDFGGDSAGRALLDESSAILEKLGDKFLLDNVLVSLGIIALSSGNYTYALSQLNRGLTIAQEIGDPYQMADALTNIGCVLRIQGEYAAASSCFEEALRIYQQVGSGMWCTDPLCALAENDIALGHLSAARLRLQDASASAEASENRWLQTLVGYFQGSLAYYEGDMERAATLLETTVALARESQYKPDLARSLIALGRVMRARGDIKQAVARLQEGLDLYRRLGHKLGVAIGLEGLAGLAVDKDATYSVILFGAAKAIRETIGAPLPPVDCPLYESDVARARAQLGEDAFTSAWAKGEAMSLEQAIELAMTI